MDRLNRMLAGATGMGGLGATPGTVRDPPKETPCFDAAGVAVSAGRPASELTSACE